MFDLPNPFPNSTSFELFWTILGNLLGQFSMVALAVFVTVRMRGEAISIPGAIAAALKLAPLLFAVYVLMTLATGIGFILLIVPGIILMLALITSPIILAIETRNPLRAMSASMDLTRNNRLRILVLIILPILLIAGLSFVADSILVNFTMAQPDSPTVNQYDRYEWLTNYVVWPATVLLYDLMFAPLLVAIYLQLKKAKGEPVGPVETIGDTFG